MHTALARSQSGFTLLESLIAGFILTVALLSIAALQTTASRVELEAQQRSRALVLVDDMVNRINANRNNAANYVTGADSALGTGDTRPATCTGSGATLDLCEWSRLLKGSAVSSGGSSLPAIAGAQGCVLSSASASVQQYFVVVSWLSQTRSSAAAVRCGGSTADPYRRSLVRVLRIANLNNLTIPPASPVTP